MDIHAWGEPDDPAILLTGDEDRWAGLWDEESCRRLAAATRYVIRRAATDGPVPRSVPEEATDVLRMLDRWGIGRVHLVGGAVARFIAVHHPQRVESLALTAGGGQSGAAVPTLVFHDSTEPPPAAAHTTPVPIGGTVADARDAVVTALLRHTSGGWDPQGDRLAARAIGAGDPTGWFDRLYAAAAAGEVDMPWDRDTPHPLLAEWAADRGVRGGGGRGIVCGCGLGADAEFIAGRGFRTVGFDVAETAVRIARERHPGSAVDYRVADLLDPPEHWLRSFDLVVEVITVQALPDPPRRAAIVNVGRLVAPGGTLVVIALRGDGTRVDGPPWPLTRNEIDAFATDGLDTVRIEKLTDPRRADGARWRAEFRRPG